MGHSPGATIGVLPTRYPPFYRKVHGNVIKIDVHTLIGDKKKFAAMCILMKSNQKVSGRIWVVAVGHNLIWSDSPWVCNACHRVGHNGKKCPERLVDMAGMVHNVAGKIGEQENQKDEGKWIHVHGHKSKKNEKIKKKVGAPTRWTPKKSELERNGKAALQVESNQPDTRDILRSGVGPENVQKNTHNPPKSCHNRFEVLETEQEDFLHPSSS